MADINVTLAQTTALMERLNQNLNSMVTSTQRLVRDQSDSSESYRTHKRLLDDDSDQLELREDQLKKDGRLTDAEIKRRIELEQALRKQVKVVEDLNKAIKSEKDQGKLQQLLERRTSAVSVMNKRKEALAADKLGGNLLGIAKKFNLLGVAISFIIGLFVGQYKQSKAFIEASAGFVEGTSLLDATMRRTAQALEFAMDPVELQKMMVANRQVVHALGGTEKTLQRVTPAFEEFRRFGVDAKDAMQAALESLTMFRKLGIQATIREQVAYAQDVAKMGEWFGDSEVAARQFFDEIANEADSIDILKKARADERAAILQSQRSFIVLARAQGMTAENAKEAAKMLNKMVGAKPLDRLKQAARTRALAGAMGVGGGEEAAAAIRAGSRASPEQRAQLAEFSKNMATAADTMRGAGLGSEIFAEALLEKLDPEQMFGRGSPFSMSLAETMKIDTEQRSKQMADLSSKTDAGAAVTRGIYDALTRGGVMLSSVTGIFAGVREIVRILSGGAIGDFFSAVTGGTSSAEDEVNKLFKQKTAEEMKVEKSTQAAMKDQEKRFQSPGAKAQLDEMARTQQENLMSGVEQLEEAKSTRKGIEQQVKNTDASNEALAKLKEAADKQNALLEKQIALDMMTEQEKQETNLRSRVREGNKFLESYGYL